MWRFFATHWSPWSAQAPGEARNCYSDVTREDGSALSPLSPLLKSSPICCPATQTEYCFQALVLKVITFIKYARAHLQQQYSNKVFVWIIKPKLQFTLQAKYILFTITYAFSAHLLGYSLIWQTTVGSWLSPLPDSHQKSQVVRSDAARAEGLPHSGIMCKKHIWLFTTPTM